MCMDSAVAATTLEIPAAELVKGTRVATRCPLAGGNKVESPAGATGCISSVGADGVLTVWIDGGIDERHTVHAEPQDLIRLPPFPVGAVVRSRRAAVARSTQAQATLQAGDMGIVCAAGSTVGGKVGKVSVVFPIGVVQLPAYFLLPAGPGGELLRDAACDRSVVMPSCEDGCIDVAPLAPSHLSATRSPRFSSLKGSPNARPLTPPRTHSVYFDLPYCSRQGVSALLSTTNLKPVAPKVHRGVPLGQVVKACA